MNNASQQTGHKLPESDLRMRCTLLSCRSRSGEDLVCVQEGLQGFWTHILMHHIFLVLVSHRK